MDKKDVVYIHNGILFSQKKEWNNTICSKVDGPRDYHIKIIISEREWQIYDTVYMWDLKHDTLLSEYHQHGVQALRRGWPGGLYLLWASWLEVGCNCRCYWSEQGFGGWTLHSSKETRYAFQMHAAHWLHPQVPTQCPPEVSLESLGEGRYQCKVGSHKVGQEDWSQRKESQDDGFWLLQSHEGKEKEEQTNQETSKGSSP